MYHKSIKTIKDPWSDLSSFWQIGLVLLEEIAFQFEHDKNLYINIFKYRNVALTYPRIKFFILKDISYREDMFHKP